MAGDPAPLASLSLTHIYYDPEDPISYLCAYFGLVPQALCVVYVTLILTTREAEIVLLGAGQFFCEVLNFALKRLIKEQRPPRLQGVGYGMPSSHAQFTAFWGVSVALFLVLRHRPTKRGTGAGFMDGDRPFSLLERVGLSLAGCGLAGLTAWSRVYLGYHTPRQVIAGVAAGTVSSVAWFVLVEIVRKTGLLSWALDNPLAKMFRFRDLAVEEDMCQAGWEKWQQKRTQSLKEKQR